MKIKFTYIEQDKREMGVRLVFFFMLHFVIFVGLLTFFLLLQTVFFSLRVVAKTTADLLFVCVSVFFIRFVSHNGALRSGSYGKYIYIQYRVEMQFEAANRDRERERENEHRRASDNYLTIDVVTLVKAFET